MSTTITLPQARIPLGWAMVQGKKIPVEIDIEWMLALIGLVNRTGGTSGDTNFDQYLNQFFDAPLVDPSVQEIARAIDELRNSQDGGTSPLIRELSGMVDDLRNEIAVIAGREQSLQGQLADLSTLIDGSAKADQLRARIEDLENQFEASRPAPVPRTAEQFIAPTLLNSWVNFGSPFNNAGYFKDPYGVVHLRGLVKSGIIGSAIATLPAGYRPQNTEIMSTISNDLFGCIKILATGDVVPAIGNNTYFSMDNISFRAA